MEPVSAFREWKEGDLATAVGILRGSFPTWWNAMRLPLDAVAALKISGFDIDGDNTVFENRTVELRKSPAVPTSNDDLATPQAYAEFLWDARFEIEDYDMGTGEAIMLRVSFITLAHS